MVEQIFLSPQEKQSMIISHKLVFVSCRNSGKSQNFIELLPSAQPPSRNENFVITSKYLLNNSN